MMILMKKKCSDTGSAGHWMVVKSEIRLTKELIIDMSLETETAQMALLGNTLQVEIQPHACVHMHVFAKFCL